MTYHLSEYESVLQQPCLLHCSLHPRIVRRAVDLSGSFTQSNENVFNLDMRVGAVADRCLLQELSEQQWILANTLDWLMCHQYKCMGLERNMLTLTRRSPMVSAFFALSP